MRRNLGVMILSMLAIALLILLFSIFIFYETEKNFVRSYTKAICDGSNFCEDYEISCDGNKLVRLNPTGFAVQFPKDWIDERKKETIQKLC